MSRGVEVRKRRRIVGQAILPAAAFQAALGGSANLHGRPAKSRLRAGLPAPQITIRSCLPTASTPTAMNTTPGGLDTTPDAGKSPSGKVLMNFPKHEFRSKLRLER